MAERNAIEPTRAQNYPEWYQQVIRAGDLAELSPVRGCMVIKPWGYGIWENIQRVLDGMFKATGHRNAYFPLFIPLSFIQKEAEHVEGFAKECAVVTHHRLQAGDDGQLVPAGELEEPLVVRPTSETIIGAMYAKWVQSYRDLPLLLNQWANIVRWEMRTRLFLRTTEFLWQEGHTAHATEEEAREETTRMLKVYTDFAEQYMAMPVIPGRKTDAERFPGAVETYSIEAMMQDGKALQAGTSHFLGQNFARASGIKFLDKDGLEKYAWTTSWGVSTRLIGGLIMTHGDDNGLVLPPAVAPIQVVIIPIAAHKPGVLDKSKEIADSLKSSFRVKLDDSDNTPGWKFAEYEMKGVPLRLEIGPKDIENNQCVLVRRDNREKYFVALDNLTSEIDKILKAYAENIYNKALENMHNRTYSCKTMDEIKETLKEKGEGFIKAMWCGEEACEDKVKEETGVASRCIPLEQEHISDTCVCCGKKAKHLLYWGIAY